MVKGMCYMRCEGCAFVCKCTMKWMGEKHGHSEHIAIILIPSQFTPFSQLQRHPQNCATAAGPSNPSLFVHVLRCD